jgi:hypothetical protein
MDQRNRSAFPHRPFGEFGSDTAPIAADVRRHADQDKTAVFRRDHMHRRPTAPLDDDSRVIFCGDVREVSAGFAMALRAMGAGANVVDANLALPTTSSNEED